MKALDGPLRAVQILIVTFLAAVVLHFLVETPTKQLIAKLNPKPVHILAFFLCLLFLQTAFLGIVFSSCRSQKEAQDEPLALVNMQYESSTNSTDEKFYFLCNEFRKFGSIFLTGDSYTEAWVEPFLELKKECNISFEYAHMWESASPYLTNLEKTERDTTYNYQTYRVKAQIYLTKTRPNLTFFFTRTIQKVKLWYGNFSGISVDDNLLEWEKLIRQAYFEFVPYALKYTTGVFLLEHPHAINEPKKCLKRIKNLHKDDWLNYANQCQAELKYDSGIEVMRNLFKDLKQTYDRFYYIDLGPLIFHNQSSLFVFDSVSDGVIVWKNSAHISTEFARKKIGVLAEEIINQNIHTNTFAN